MDPALLAPEPPDEVDPLPHASSSAAPLSAPIESLIADRLVSLVFAMATGFPVRLCVRCARTDGRG